jgi:hypothetical protein
MTRIKKQQLVTLSDFVRVIRVIRGFSFFHLLWRKDSA